MNDPLRLEADVLVIGGGLAGCWTAAAAAQAGASVILAEKGYCGTSGVTATAGPSHWWVPPEPPAAREQAIAERHARGFGLSDPAWMARILDITWRTLPTLAPFYRFSVDDQGQVQHRGLRGPEYMRAMRALVEHLGVTILDQSPALELLTRHDGTVAGAAGHRRQEGRDWIVRAGAVVIATGGCAFASHLLGAGNNTGEGLLMAVEAGADLSGMEFTNYYTVAPAGTTMTRSMAYTFGRYFDADDRELGIHPGPDMNRALGEALLKGPVFCRLDRVPQDIRERMPQVQPNFVLTFARQGIDPYRDRFAVTLRAEGTVRGIGGLRLQDQDCRTRVRGLYAAGDAATRELVAGATSGGGNQNSAWALSSGQIAGAAAAGLALREGRGVQRIAYVAGRAGLRPSAGARSFDVGAAVELARREMGDLDKNMFRRGEDLAASLDRLSSAFAELATHGSALGGERQRLREAAGMLAAARWSKASALARAESRGMHHRSDAPASRAQFASRQRSGGLESVWTRFERQPAEAVP
ncbi:MAG: oxidoreductase [Phenylobacterium sp.]|uniref:FAD-binding protein n=1 Tax=Phenylobacterium sp. TaxID=1871053 RepID=UPI0025FA55FD|nr:FAD-binding protein [Phenylobacterium sp.]MBA4010303.1 oxidoreductase [Phenylobacterium sp.]